MLKTVQPDQLEICSHRA